MTTFYGSRDDDMAPPLHPERQLTPTEQRIMDNALHRTLKIIPDGPSLHPERLAVGGAIDVPPPRHRDVLHTWFRVFLHALLTLFVLAVMYGYFAITP